MNLNDRLKQITALTLIDKNIAPHFELRLPKARRILGPIVPEEFQDPQRNKMWIATEACAWILSMDGSPVYLKRGEELMADPLLSRQLLDARDELFSLVREQGRFYAQCPHCQTGESELDLLALMVALELPAPALHDAARLQLPLASSIIRKRGRRPKHVPVAASIRAVPPSFFTEEIPTESPVRIQSCHLKYIDQAAAAIGWQKWEYTDVEGPPKGRAHWHFSHPGFRGMLHLTLCLTDVKSNHWQEEITPALLDELPITDVFFLDALYFLLFNVDASEDKRILVNCEVCGKSFLALG